MASSMPVSVSAKEAPRQPLFTAGWFRYLLTAEMSERVSFFGLQAVLVLYATAPKADGGLGLSDGTAAAMFGAYIGLTFTMALPGGWIADRLIGQQRAMLLGLASLSLGAVMLASTRSGFLVIGLLLMSIGFGLFKPNHQAMANLLAGERRRRESTIAAFFVGVQVVGLLAPIVIGYLGERVSWPLAFATIAVPVAIGLGVTAANRGRFGELGRVPGRPLSALERHRFFLRTTWALGVLLVLVVAGLATGALKPQLVLGVVGLVLVALPWFGYARLRRSPGLTATHRKNLSVMLRLMLAGALFWLLIGQDASVLTLFAKESTDRTVGSFTVPSSWLQAATPLFMLVLAPVLAWQLPRFGARYSVPAKFVFSLVLAGVSLLVMSVAAVLAQDGPVSPLWLLAVFLMHAVGEIVIAAISISSIADLVPSTHLGQAIGIYWLFAALGGGLATGVSKLIDVLSAPVYFGALGTAALLVALWFVAAHGRLNTPWVTPLVPAQPAGPAVEA